MTNPNPVRKMLTHPANSLWTCAGWIGTAVALVAVAYIASAIDGHPDALLEGTVKLGIYAVLITAVSMVIAAAIESLVTDRGH